MADITTNNLPADITLVDALDSTLTIDAPSYGDGQPWGAEAIIEVVNATSTILFAVGTLVSADSAALSPGEKIIVTLGGADASKRLNFKGANGDVFRVSI